MLRDRLVCGISKHRIQRWLSKTTLNFKNGYEIALGMEIAAKNAKDIQQAVLTLEASQMTGRQNVSKVCGSLKNARRRLLQCYGVLPM